MLGDDCFERIAASQCGCIFRAQSVQPITRFALGGSLLVDLVTNIGDASRESCDVLRQRLPFHRELAAASTHRFYFGDSCCALAFKALSVAIE